jgi:murein DD-endopeptidase MepM/ murein hydrolase activator NlpD
MTYVRPVDPVNGRMSTYRAHTRRVPPSSEAGVDYYCPIGTPIRAAGPARVVDIGGGIVNATGRYVTIDLLDGRRARYLHLSRWKASIGQIVDKGTIIGYSGASGYGSEFFGATSVSRIPLNTGGPHVHATLWPTHAYKFGRYPLEPTLDLELYVDTGSAASDNSTPFRPLATLTPQEDSMLYLHVSGDKPFFTVLNVNTNVYYPPVQGNAPAAWTAAWGAPKKVTLADFNTLISTVWTVTGQVPYEGTQRQVSA